MKLNVGDYVRIEPLSEAQKQIYPYSWDFDMDKYIGNIIKITRISEGPRYRLECDNGRYVWSDSHLKHINPSNIILF